MAHVDRSYLFVSAGRERKGKEAVEIKNEGEKGGERESREEKIWLIPNTDRMLNTAPNTCILRVKTLQSILVDGTNSRDLDV